jgi:Fe2+ or Zn2+ uptake regulation protein
MSGVDLSTTLRDHGHRVTSQRVILHRVLTELDRHATAEEIAREAEERLPGMSLPTVYATLELFEELGLVRRVNAGGPTLFDPNPDGHSHFACRRCGAVLDVPAPVDAAVATAQARRAGLQVEGVEVVLRGLCGACSSDGA